MTLIVARRTPDDLLLEIDAASSLVKGPTASLQVAHREVLLALLLVAGAPAVVRYETIQQEILVPFNIGMPPSDPLVYIRKLKLALDRTFAAATGAVGLISTVRGVGYRLAGEWQVSFPHRRGEQLIKVLRQLGLDCVYIMTRLPLVADENNSLSLDPSVDPSVVSDLDRRYLACAEQIAATTASRSEKDRETLFTSLREVYSYMTFSRHGAVDEESWRYLFERELLAKVDELARLL